MKEVIVENVKIENMIYEIRGKKVMFVSDVSRLYNIESKRVNEVVKRNIKRFPKDFCFRLTDIEMEIFWSQNATKKINVEKRGGSYKNPCVFSEHGVIMLSGLLKSDTAIKMNILIINAFMIMKKYISSNLLEQYLFQLTAEKYYEILRSRFRTLKVEYEQYMKCLLRKTLIEKIEFFW